MNSTSSWNLPNLLSLSRFPMAIAFLATDSQDTRLWLVGLASFSDLLDGWLARWRGLSTKWGALLDPIADKTFVLCALLAFYIDGALGTRDYFIVLARDFAAAVGFLVAWWLPGLDPLSFKARWSGKVVTVLQLSVLLALLVAPRWVEWLVLLIAAASVWSIVDYTLALRRSRSRADG